MDLKIEPRTQALQEFKRSVVSEMSGESKRQTPTLQDCERLLGPSFRALHKSLQKLAHQFELLFRVHGQTTPKMRVRYTLGTNAWRLMHWMQSPVLIR